MRAALYRDMGHAAGVFQVEEVDRPAHEAAEGGAVGKVIVTP